MSKAFTREDDASELPPARPAVSLPPGVKNYITREGADQLRRECDDLQTRRSQAAAANDRTRLQAFDQRIAECQQILNSVTVVEPTASADNQARFGAYVRVKYPSGDIETFRVVGVHEIDLARNFISWQSPLARALLNARAGDIVNFKAPAGPQRLEILAVSHEPI
jgi:transcription elongation factor GreB